MEEQEEEYEETEEEEERKGEKRSVPLEKAKKTSSLHISSQKPHRWYHFLYIMQKQIQAVIELGQAKPMFGKRDIVC